ncbi:ATP-grasp domain-containing protein [Enterobacter asburiae]|nr:ATP-grasp domain-containing protein [Enterobacter asburiae]
MNNKIWLMEGLSSQKDLIQRIKSFADTHHLSLTVYASHRHERNEILSVADYALLEPQEADERLQFITDIVATHGIHHIHAGRNTLWFEENRAAIEATGVSLTTGATSANWLALAEDKVAFAGLMQQHALPVVPSWRVNSVSELQSYLASPPFSDSPVCVKPVTGIYGMGFWRFDDTASAMDLFNHPENRIVNSQQYLAALATAESFKPLVLMPYLPGPEYSVDILADNGEVLAAVGRRKEGAIQYLVNEGAAFELACNCARAMNADGLVNVQTRNNHQGTPLLLEINMRPSGGIGYTQHSGVNLPGLFAAYKLGLLTKDEITTRAASSFAAVAVRAVTDVLLYPQTLSNRLN